MGEIRSDVNIMSRTNQREPPAPTAGIAAVERDTGLSKDLLRMWERRYGFPRPQRDSRGERVYPPEQIEKLRVIRRLLDGGMRPGQLMRLPLSELLEQVAGEPRSAAAGREPTSALLPMMEQVIERLRQHDEVGVRAHLSRMLLRLGLQRFAIEFAAPLNELVGEAWARGDITVGQEHLYAEQMQQLLRQGIGSIPEAEQRPAVLLTTLPGEQHQLGLLMAQLCLALEGARCVSFGVQTPPTDIVNAAREQGVDAVGLSFSEALKLNVAYDMLEDLRMRLPAEVEIWAGGRLWARARRTLPGVRFVTGLRQIPEVLAAHRDSRGRQPTATDSV